MSQSLPPKYYLDHGLELFNYIRSHCQHLLVDDHKQYLSNFFLLSEDAQCLLIRFIARKPRFLKRSSLSYPEITNLDIAVEELKSAQFISFPGSEDWHHLVPSLTKAQLLSCLRNSSLKLPASTKKEALVSAAREYFSGDEPCLFILRESYFKRRQQAEIDYILYLFFGDLKNRFQRFVMRDLGVLKTRKANKSVVARFDDIEEAQSAFTFQIINRDLSAFGSADLFSTAEFLLTTRAVGDTADSLRQKLLLQAGILLADNSPQLAIQLWQQSDLPKALEKRVRLAYKLGDREGLKNQLQSMLNGGLPAAKQIFVEDFFARKYLGKRTSIYTDMLRENSLSMDLDEAYINYVEQGVLTQYRTAGAKCFFTENNFWRCLFALAFWELLYDEQQHNEFDRLPSQLARGNFYANNESALEESLKIFNKPNVAIQKFIKLLSRHYGYPNGLFNWRTSLAEHITVFLRYALPNAIKDHLRSMAKAYHTHNDGYPDLMLVENKELKFIEVKAPGDSLRENQLVCINRLRQSGFNIDLLKVSWQTNPEQVYAVVDIETTGGKPGLHSITEVAIVKVRDSKVIDKWSSLVNPQCRIPKHITHLTGIDNKMVESSPIFAELADTILDQLGGTIFVAHNVGFDYGFLKLAFTQLGYDFRFPQYCTVRNCRKSFPGLRSYSLSNLVSHFSLTLKQAHRALDDASATAELLMLIQAKNSGNS